MDRNFATTLQPDPLTVRALDIAFGEVGVMVEKLERDGDENVAGDPFRGQRKAGASEPWSRSRAAHHIRNSTSLACKVYRLDSKTDISNAGYSFLHCHWSGRFWSIFFA